MFAAVHPWKLWPVGFCSHPWKWVSCISLALFFLLQGGALDVLFWMDLIVFPFVNISLTASMDANFELQMIAGTSLSAAVKNCIACAILSSAVM